MRVERGASVRDVPLDDPGDHRFLALPVLDLDDGRGLRRAAWDRWSSNVRAALARGAEFETSYRPPRPLVTALAIGGGGLVCVICATLLWTWAFRPTPSVRVEPTPAESLAIVIAVTVVVGVIVAASGALLRAWRCRRGSYAHVAARGVRTRRGGVAEPFESIAAADWHAFVRCTRIEFMDGRPDLWVPSDAGAARRIDLLLAAADDRLGAEARRRL